MSIAGGYHKAVIAAKDAECDTVQLFTKNNTQWRAKELSSDEIQLFTQHIKKTGITTPTAHAAYLINLASPDRALWKRSLDAFIIEIRRSEALDLKYLVVHPGSHKESTVEQGIRRIAQALNEAHRQTPGAKVQVLLEITAGQGTNLGYRFEQIAKIIDRTQDPDRLGVCFDTCHAHAAGYTMTTKKQYRETIEELDRTVGLRQVKVFHLNDSKTKLGSRVDRHEHIGCGHLGLKPFRFLINDRRFQHKPMFLETPKGQKKGEDMDVVNLRQLRALLEMKDPPRETNSTR